MANEPPNYLLRQRLKITRDLLQRGTSNEFSASYDAHYESIFAEFWDNVFGELVGRDAPSALGKAIRVAIPIWVAYSLGFLTKKPEVIWAAAALYAIAAIVFLLVRRSRKKAARAQERVGDNAWLSAAEAADAAIASSHPLLRRSVEVHDPGYVTAMAELNEANTAMLRALRIPKRRWNTWRFVDKP